MLPGRTLLPHLINGIAWGCVLQWPWGETLFPALGVLAVVHLVQPLWSHWTSRGRLLHRAFATGPLVMFATDASFLIAAWRQDLWGDLTTVFVPVLGAAAVLVLAYAAAVMTLLRRRQR